MCSSKCTVGVVMQDWSPKNMIANSVCLGDLICFKSLSFTKSPNCLSPLASSNHCTAEVPSFQVYIAAQRSFSLGLLIIIIKSPYPSFNRTNFSNTSENFFWYFLSENKWLNISTSQHVKCYRDIQESHETYNTFPPWIYSCHTISIYKYTWISW